MSSSTHERSLVVGLDGVPHWLLRQLADEGVMPAVGDLLSQGALRPLRAPVPEISSTSWASFLTGSDPGRHGIYGFTDLAPHSYRMYFPNCEDLRAAPLWEQTSRAGLPALVLNVPGSYPAPAVDGAFVSGFVSPDFDRAVQPPRLRRTLREFGYQLDVEVGEVASDPDGFLTRVEQALAARSRTFQHLLAEEPWNLAVCVITETDRVHHFLWDQLTDSTRPLHKRVLEFYQQVDEVLARLVPFAEDSGLTLVSDHGFGPVHTQFYVNAWLREAGYLALPADADSLEAIDERTSAFALDPARIYLNDLVSWPRGRALDPGLTDEIAQRLLHLRRTEDGSVTESGSGMPLVSEVLRGPELYSGPEAGRAPALVAMPAAGVQLRGGWATREPIVGSPLTGTHTRSDATFWSRGDQGSGIVEMRDVAVTVLAELGVAPAPSMEGQDVRGLHTGQGIGLL